MKLSEVRDNLTAERIVVARGMKIIENIANQLEKLDGNLEVEYSTGVFAIGEDQIALEIDGDGNISVEFLLDSQVRRLAKLHIPTDAEIECLVGKWFAKRAPR